MGRRVLLLGLLGLVGVLGMVSGSAAGTPPAVGWEHAVEVPGTAALNSGGNATVFSVSCGAAHHCTAGGFYKDGSGHTQAYVVSEASGSWGDAVEVPGTAALNGGGTAVVESVSCAAAGACAAGGYYKDGSGNRQAFVVGETNGSWGDAVEVPGTAALNSGGSASVDSVSCAAAGACAAGGHYSDGSNYQAFVVSETNGTWGDAVEVPGTAALNSGGNASVDSVSCGAVGACAAAGYYADGSANRQAFVVNETNGSWSDAVEVPGTAALNTGGDASVDEVSCAAAGACSAGGYYTDGSGRLAFVGGETNGSWGAAVKVPGTATLNNGGFARVYTVSCAAAGSCSAGGIYTDGSGHIQAFVVSKTKGSWGKGIEVPGTAALNKGGSAGLESVSCAAVGVCAAGGVYKDGSAHSQAFVLSETNGRWGKATEIPGSPTLNGGGSAGVNSVSCTAAGACAAAGGYKDGSANYQAFVVNYTSPCIVPRVVGKTLSAAKRMLKAAHCGVGKTTRAYSKLKRGRVVAEKPRAGKHLKSGAKVALTLSKGKKK